MSSIADVITTLDRALLRIRDIDACLRHATEAWTDATSLLRMVLEGSQDPDAELLLAHCTAAEHAETKLAVWMRARGVTHTTVVINHPRVCGPPYGCEVAVRTTLP